VRSSERSLQAMRWLLELETHQHGADAVWPEFDAWYQASAANRKEYLRIKRAVLRRGTSVESRRFAVTWHRLGKRVQSSRRVFLNVAGSSQIYLIVAASLIVLIYLLQPGEVSSGARLRSIASFAFSDR
jgi:ferric-dicitrate binding protein FerR (iron transport regulator)